ncbi:MarR family winged helix-turn-helix transcriptional regulator [Candidatus Poriferisocius sp.]|uniref:MarR family winged helix-turn-helix transcriptional regulator n=1 Tax=Candidatus Poriferisocius sp. TaxID=3101276 RepID=UPI003B5A944C
MTMPPAPTPDERLLDAEVDIRERLGEYPLDFASLLAISNIYRAATAVRRRAERGVLAQADLSWGGFTILWVLWVWGEMETARLASECDLAKGTLTGMVTTLEKQDLVQRTRLASDRRRVRVGLTPAGLDTIERLFPAFNGFEGEMSEGLSDAEKGELARLLRVVTTNASGR